MSSFTFWFSILAVFSAIFSGFGCRWGWWHFRTGFMILRISAYSCLAAVIISLIGLFVFKKCVKLKNIFAILFGLSVIAIPWSWIRIAKKVPAIHDITTDTDNPPLFVAIPPLRKGAQNAIEYGGVEIAKKQKVAYPDITTLSMNVPMDQAFSEAVSAAQKMHWEIVDINPKEGRIEATATTFWFGFKDDVVIRVSPDKESSKIDLRSVSRVGKGDVGTNAGRIRQYLKLLAQIEAKKAIERPTGR